MGNLFCKPTCLITTLDQCSYVSAAHSSPLTMPYTKKNQVFLLTHKPHKPWRVHGLGLGEGGRQQGQSCSALTLGPRLSHSHESLISEAGQDAVTGPGPRHVSPHQDLLKQPQLADLVQVRAKQGPPPTPLLLHTTTSPQLHLNTLLLHYIHPYFCSCSRILISWLLL